MSVCTTVIAVFVEAVTPLLLEAHPLSTQTTEHSSGTTGGTGTEAGTLEGELTLLLSRVAVSNSHGFEVLSLSEAGDGDEDATLLDIMDVFILTFSTVSAGEGTTEDAECSM
jgi:hypothetical protein